MRLTRNASVEGRPPVAHGNLNPHDHRSVRQREKKTPLRFNARGSVKLKTCYVLIPSATHEPNTRVHDHEHQVGDEHADDGKRRQQQEYAPCEIHVLLS